MLANQAVISPHSCYVCDGPSQWFDVTEVLARHNSVNFLLFPPQPVAYCGPIGKIGHTATESIYLFGEITQTIPGSCKSEAAKCGLALFGAHESHPHTSSKF